MPVSRTSTRVRRLILAALLTTTLPGLSLARAAEPAAPAGITFTAAQAYPEGIGWLPAQQVFFVSSIHQGVIGKVTLQGVYTPFITDEKLISSVGLHVDAARNLLWAAIADPGASTRSTPATQGKLAALAAYDATTGERRAYHDLGKLLEGAHFANDLALDAAGNVYVTDSFAPVIYRVDTTGRATVFATSPLFAGEGFNLNGIVAHPDGYLLVAKSNSGEIFRISTREATDIQRVNLAEAVTGVDGLVLRGRNRLSVVRNSGTDQVQDLVSSDGWKSATSQAARKSALSFPTTGVLAGNDFYVLNSRLDTLFSADAPKVNEYLLQKY